MRSFVYLLGRFCGVDFSLSFSLSNRGFLGGFSSSSTWGLDDNVRVRKEGKLAAPWFNPKRERQTRRNASSLRFQSQKKKIDKNEFEQPAVSIAKKKDKKEGLQPAVSIPKEQDRHEGGLTARGFNLKKKKTDKKESLQPAGSVLKQEDTHR